MAAASAALVFLPSNPNPHTIKPSTPHPHRLLFATPLPSSPPLRTLRTSPFRPCSAVHATAPPPPAAAESEPEKKRKLCVANFPWTQAAPNIEKLFSECGTVKKVEMIKRKNGQGRGFAFVTMASGEEARAVVQNFDSYELQGRILRVEFAKSFRKPSSTPPGVTVVEKPYTVYASNLAWEVRSTNLREFFSKFKPSSARVVFDNQRSAGYGFVSFVTEEEAEAAVSELDGKELMGRPLRLRINQKKGNEEINDIEEAGTTEGHSDDS